MTVEAMADDGTGRWEGWRDALRMTAAALVAYGISGGLGLKEGYWSVLTALIVTRPTLGGTLEASRGRLLATVGGAGLAVLVGALRIVHVPQAVVLVLTLAPLAALVAWKPDYRTAPLAAVIVLSSGGGASPLHAAGLRIVEIAIGAGVGAIVSRLVLPTRAADRGRAHHARMLCGIGDLVAAGMEGDEERIAAARERNRGEIRSLARLAGAARSEKAGEAHERATALLTRLSSDAALFARVLLLARAGGNPALEAEALKTWSTRFRDTARTVAAALSGEGSSLAVAPAGLDLAPLPGATSLDHVEQATTIRFLARGLGFDLLRATRLLGVLAPRPE